MTSDKQTIDTHKISVYTASAGSGKTYTLTRAYIRLSVAGDSYWQARQAAAVLAITFTNAAAADMKRKIMETLSQVASGADEAVDLQAETGLSAELLRQRAGEVLRYLLHDYGNFSVQTIDSFVQRVIRPFAFELGLPRTYETDIETDRWVEEIRESLLSAYGMPQQQTLTALLDGFLDEMAENEDKGRMEITPALNRVLGMAFEEKSEERLRLLSACDEAVLLQDIKGFAKRRHACEKAALAIYTELAALIRAENLEADDFQGKSRGFWTFFKNPLRDGRAVLRAFVEGEGKATWRKSVEKGFLSDASRAEAAAGIQALYDRLQGLDTARYIYEAALEKHLYALALMKRADDLKDRMQQAEGRVPISEFNRKIHGLLAQTDVPYLYERVGAVYRHILVDEFQDTSTLQWENLLPLIDNNRASGDWNMVVGDPKQSIYRFRSANVEQMLALRENTALAQNEKLVSNWRSEAGIIAFNNLFYRFLLEEFEPDKADAVPAWEAVRQRLQRIYTAHEQYYKMETACLPAEDPRAVRVCFYEKDAASAVGGVASASASADGAVETLAGGEAETYEAWNIRLIQAILRHHEPGEVAVLCTRNDRVNLVASCLVENGVKVDTDSSLLLRTSLTVRLLVAALRYMGAPRSETARRKLQWFMAQQAERAGDGAGGAASVADGAAAVSASDGGSVAVAGSASDDETLTRRLRYLRGLARSGRSLYDKLQHILRTWDLRADTDQYVLSFMDLVQRSGLRAEADFVREWEDSWAEKSMLQTAGGQRDAVRVTTVHKSKGLEYPVVIYAFASDAPRNEGWVWTQLNRAEADGASSGVASSGGAGLPVGLLSVKDALAQTVDEVARTEAETESVKAVIDRINMLYVTTTRPRLKLYVLSKEVARSGAYAENRYWARFTERYLAYLADESEWTEAEPTAQGASAAASAAVSATVPTGTDGSSAGKGAGAADAAEVGAPIGDEADADADAGATDTVAGGQAARRLAAARQTDWMPRFEPAFSYQEAAKRPERIWGEFIHSLLSGITDASRFDRAAVAAVVAEQWPEVAPSLTDDGCEAPAAPEAVATPVAAEVPSGTPPAAPATPDAPDAPAVYTPDAAVAQVEAVLAHPLLQACFSPIYRIYNERELCCDGRIYRPDRVAVGPDDLYVVDYKTGEAHAEHVRQVAAYRDLLFRMTSKPVRAYIVYIRPQTVEVKEVMASEESSASAS